MFDNLIIAIDSDDHLNLICRELKKLGYRKIRKGICKWDNYLITYSDGSYAGSISDTNYKLGYKKITLTKLIQLRKEKEENI